MSGHVCANGYILPFYWYNFMYRLFYYWIRMTKSFHIAKSKQLSINKNFYLSNKKGARQLSFVNDVPNFSVVCNLFHFSGKFLISTWTICVLCIHYTVGIGGRCNRNIWCGCGRILLLRFVQYIGEHSCHFVNHSIQWLSLDLFVRQWTTVVISIEFSFFLADNGRIPSSPSNGKYSIIVRATTIISDQRKYSTDSSGYTVVCSRPWIHYLVPQYHIHSRHIGQRQTNFVGAATQRQPIGHIQFWLRTGQPKRNECTRSISQ